MRYQLILGFVCAFCILATTLAVGSRMVLYASTEPQDKHDVAAPTLARTSARDTDSFVPPILWQAEGTATTSLSILPYQAGLPTAVARTIQYEPATTDHISMTASHPLDATLMSLGEHMVQLELFGTGATTITLSGLAPNCIYHLYVDHFGNHQKVVTNERGSLTTSITLTGFHVLIVQEHPSTYFIKDNATGGDCAAIGTWDDASNTCTLTTDVTETVQIATDHLGPSDGVTLDGAGHTLTAGAEPGIYGLYIKGTEGVTVRNLAVSGYAGSIALFDSNNATLENVSARASNTGVYAAHTQGLSLRGVSVESPAYGIYLTGYTAELAQNTTVTDTTVNCSADQAMALAVALTSTFSVQNINLSGCVMGLYLYQAERSTFENVDITVPRDRAALVVAGDVEAHFDHKVTAMSANGLPIRYYTRLENETLEGGGEELFNLYCAMCTNTTIRNFRFPTYTASGIRLWGTSGMSIAGNTFEGPTRPLDLENTSGTLVHDNVFQAAPGLAVPYLVQTSDDAVVTEVYRNSFRSGSPPVRPMLDTGSVSFSQPLPPGGNHWAEYDEPSEGCMDVDTNHICDVPYVVSAVPSISGITLPALYDECPWTSADAWDSVSAPTLTLPSEEPYDGARGVASSGPYPERGVADKDTFTFKVVYTNANNTPPQVLQVHIGTNVDDQPSVLPLTLDVAATDSALRDGNYANGEQYIATSTFPKEKYFFSFRGTITDGAAFALADDSSSHDTNILTFQTGYSSVAFIPGIQASRLFREGVLFENQLWEPNRDADAQAMRMRDTGESVDPDIYTKAGADGVVDEVFGLGSNVYKSFIGDLSDLAADGTISGYVVLPYDWRLAFGDILSQGSEVGGKLYFDASHGTDTHYIPHTLHELAESSDSGKVTIVAHSMGGLLAKALLANLEDNEEHPYRSVLDEVDTVVLVASPQLGTPKAIGALVHGYDTELDAPYLGWPNVAKGVTARSLSQNMRSAYTLLPTADYFTRVRDVAEDGTTLPYTTVISDSVGTVRDHETLTQYLTRSPYYSSDDLVEPLHLWGTFIDEAQRLHRRIDAWTPRDTDGDGIPDIRVVQIAGWGKTDTLKGIRYAQARRHVTCPAGLTGACYETIQDPQPVFTVDGDGTVVTASAVAMGTTTAGGVETWYVNLHKHNDFLRNVQLYRDHADILEVDSLRAFILNLIQDVASPLNFITDDPNSLQYDEDETYIRLSLHSPVKIDVYDGEGNHTGHTSSSTASFPLYEEQIPNSYYLEFGEGKYLGMPGTEAHTVKLDGLAKGTFTLKLQEQIGDVTMKEIVFEDIPVTASTTGTMVLTNLAAATPPILKLDLDGNGATDFTLSTAGTAVSALDRVKIAKAYAKTLTAPTWLKDWILLRLDLIEKLLSPPKNRTLQKNHVSAAKALLNTILWTIEHSKPFALPHDDAAVLKRVIESVVAEFD